MTTVFNGTLMTTNECEACILIHVLMEARKKWEDDGRPNSGDRA